MIHVSSILIGVTDLVASKAFYEQILGFTFHELRPPFASASLDGIEFNIEENTKDRPENWAKNYIGGRKQVSFQVDNLELFIRKALTHGAALVQPIEERSWGWREAIIADGDGNEFIIEQEL